ncbi:hypothetical protein JQN84_23880 [Micromonospora sp. MMS20-R2-29]|uniref:O-methyltransferase C-terminal domain-containing protein n=1 Tax=Micromonospora humidisoli TaxID=2807622 RepID=A0ABS2JGB5_9ACTN|nr:hypothetical protein [Micromonospora humidisoli]
MVTIDELPLTLLVDQRDAPYTLPAAPPWIAESWSCSGQRTRLRLGNVRSKVAKSGLGPGGCAGPRPTRTFRVGRRSPLGDRPGNFFDEVPAGGDIHAFQYILHDWDDDRCVRILRDCRRARNTRTAGVVGTGHRPARGRRRPPGQEHRPGHPGLVHRPGANHGAVRRRGRPPADPGHRQTGAGLAVDHRRPAALSGRAMAGPWPAPSDPGG